MQPQANTTNQLKSTQNSLLISEVKDGVVVLKDGSLRAVVLASAINFDLMSREEQDAVEYSYQGFLNSLHFPIQIVVRSQKISLDNYIEGLAEKQAGQDNELLAMLMEDYIANIRALIEEVNIMNKQFYVVVPFFPAIITKNGFFNNLQGIFKGVGVTTVQEADFNAYKTELSQRVALVASGLNQMGIRAIPLNSQELIDLYYSAYNPDVAVNQKLIEASQLQAPVVTRSNEALPNMNNQQVVAAEPLTPIAQTQAPKIEEPVPAPVYAEPAQPIYQPAPQAPAPVPAPAPIPVAPTPQVSQQPAVNPTNFDPYALQLPIQPAAPAPELPGLPPAPAPAPALSSDEAAAQAAEAVANTLPTSPNGGIQ